MIRHKTGDGHEEAKAIAYWASSLFGGSKCQLGQQIYIRKIIQSPYSNMTNQQN